MAVPYWHPCDDCLDPLAKALREFGWKGGRGLAERLTDTGTRWSFDIERSPRRVRATPGIEVCRRWLEQHISVEYSKVFHERVATFFQKLRAWEQEAARDPGRDEDELSRETGFCQHLRDGFDDVKADALELADYLQQMAAMITAGEGWMASGATPRNSVLSISGSASNAPSRAWNPCVDCLDPLADALQRFQRCKVWDLPERLKRPITHWSHEIGEAAPWYAGQSGIEVCRGWLELNISVDYAKVFVDRIQAFLRGLRDWEREARSTPLEYGDDALNGEGRFCQRLRERFDELCGEAIRLALYLRQMSAMLKPKLRTGRSSANNAPTNGPPDASSVPAGGEGSMITVKEAAIRLLRADESITKPKHAMRLVSGAASDEKIRSNGLRGKGKRLLVEESFESWLLRRLQPQSAKR